MNDLKYVHYRVQGEDGKVMGKGGATIAYRFLSPKGSESKHIEYAIAYCHPNDNFNRRIGRYIASGRFNVGQKAVADSLEAISKLMQMHYGYVSKAKRG